MREDAMNPYSDISKIKKSKSTSSKESLKDAFLELYKKKAYNQISVKMLCEKAHVARTTFYSNYANMDDLLEEIEDDIIYNLLKVNSKCESIGNLQVSESTFAKNLMKFIDKNRTTLKILMVEQTDARLLIKWRMAVKYHFYPIVCQHNGGKEDEMVLEMIASMAISAYTYLITHGEKSLNDKITQTISLSLDILK